MYVSYVPGCTPFPAARPADRAPVTFAAHWFSTGFRAHLILLVAFSKKAEELSRLGSFKLKISFLRRRDLLWRYVKCRQLSREQSCHSSLLRLPRSRLWRGTKFSRYRLKHLLVTHARRPDNDRPTRSSRILAPLRMDGDAHSSAAAGRLPGERRPGVWLRLPARPVHQ